jgi:hypothetical protein
VKSIYVSDDLHRRAKVRAALGGRSLRELVEEQTERGLHRHLAEAQPGTLCESAVGYAPAPALAAHGDLAVGSGQILAPQREEGGLVDEERLQRMLDAVFALLWLHLGAEPAAGPPPEIDQIRDVVARYQAQSRGVPSLSELAIAMREER